MAYIENNRTYVKMDPELKAKWLEALRSGRYTQGRHRLRTEDKYCCLGVLCDVVDRSQWVGNESGWRWGERYYDPPGRLLAVEASGKLAILNDAERASFPRIADWIEENL